MEKVRRVTPDCEKMQADSSHVKQQQQERLYQKVLLLVEHRRNVIARYTLNFRSKYSLITKL